MPILAALVLALSASVPAATPGNGETAAKLHRLQAEIAKLNAAERSEIAHKHKLLGELGTLEEHIGALNRELASLAEREHKLAARKQTLEQQTAQAENTAVAAQQELGTMLRAAFILGREPEIKLALEGDDPTTAARLLGYYGYYSRAQSEHIATLTAEIANYRKLQDAVAATAQELEETAAARRKSLADLQQTHNRREAVVTQLTSDIANKHAQAESLRSDAARLEKIVQSVSRDIAQIPVVPLEKVAFGKLRGKLPWPVAGKIVDRYGAPRAEAVSGWQAVRIAAPAGTKVRAIAYGRIAYAGWLPYYGLVLILDHGDGFLTVYGHNEALYKQVGDQVRPGDVIATVGDSGGQPRPMLYFQIRHDDHPLNPEQWCAHGAPPPR